MEHFYVATCRPNIYVWPADNERNVAARSCQVMELYARQRAVLELEYFGEVGTGLGPTLEFYTLLSHELQKRSLNMWRHEEPAPPGIGPANSNQATPMMIDGETEGKLAGGRSRAIGVVAAATGSTRTAASAVQLHHDASAHDTQSGSAADYVNAPFGLFPAPLAETQTVARAKVLEHFRLLGRTVAKALQDSRLLDLPLSHVFYRAALERSLDLYDVAAFDPALGQSLERLQAALHRYQAAGSTGDVVVDGCRIGDLYLTFTLPGR